MRGNKNKLAGLLFLLIMAVSPVFAQKSVPVFQPLTWEQASMLATRENKIVFADVVSGETETTNRLEKAVAGNKQVADFFRKNVIAIRLDVQTTAGRAFVPKLMMNAYPAAVFFLPYGDLLTLVVPAEGIKNPQLLLAAGKKALERAEVKRSNSRFIRFDDMGLQEAFEKARQEEKLLFVMAYTDDSQACLMMDKDVFNLDKVAVFYNKSFINLRINFGRERDLVEKYGVSVYPSFLFLNGNGKRVYQAAGYMEADSFVDLGKEALKKAEGIAFTGGTLREIAKMAEEQGRLIFTDCYSSTEAARKALVKTVYTDPEVASFFNEHFVNSRLNMEEGEGRDFKKEYGVEVCPALYFTDYTGRMVHRVVGIPDAAGLLREAHRVVDGRGLASMITEYEGGKRDAAFIEEYLEVLEVGDSKKEAAVVALEYLSVFDGYKLKEKKYWELFEKYVADVNSDIFKYIYANRDEFYSLFGEKQVGQKLNTVWVAGADAFLTDTGFDEAGFKEYVKRMKKEKVKDWRMIVRDAGMKRAEKTGDWRTYVELAEEKWKEEQIPDAELYRWGMKINQECRDEAIRFKAARWFALAADEMARTEWKTGKVNISSYKGFFEKLVDDLVGKK